MNSNFIKDMKARLEKEIDDTVIVLEQLEAVIKTPESKNEEECADQLVSMQNANSQKVACDRKLSLIKKALFKLNEGNYGICVDCEDEISEKRLIALPHIATCIDCAEARESATKLGR